MKLLKYGCLAMAMSVIQAQAALIALGNFVAPNMGNPGNEQAYLESTFGIGPLTYLAKPVESGAVSAALFTSSSGWSGTLATTLSWDLTGTGYGLSYILVKDGGNVTIGNETGHLYALYQVAPGFELVGSGEVSFAPINREISHVTFFGTPSSSQVPDGGTTLALLGLSLCGLGVARKLRGAKA